MNILYEDNHLIAVEKPPGVLTQGDSSGSSSLLDQVKAFIKERDKKPGNVFIGLLHRLDRNVGGVVLFAKTSKGASRLSQQIRERTIDKTYEALVEGTPPDRGVVQQWLRKNQQKNIVHDHNTQVPGSLYAETVYRVMKRGEISRVQLQPATGRPHQIRVAMASLNTPIVGDSKYGAKKKWRTFIALHATSFSFNHPITDERITIESPAPFTEEEITN